MRAQSPAFKQRVVFVSALIFTIVLVGGMYGVQSIIQTTSDRNTELAQGGVKNSSPFSIVSQTWKDMVGYVERVSGDLVPEGNIFKKKDSDGPKETPVQYPGLGSPLEEKQ